MELNLRNPLGYIEIKNPPLKLLIDTDRNKSILHADIVNDYFPNNIIYSLTFLK